MTRLYDEERLGVLLRILRPAPPVGCEAAQELPGRSTYARRDRLAGRGGPRVPRGARRRPRAGARGRGLRARPPPPRRDPRRVSAKAEREGTRRVWPRRVPPVQDVDAHSWDASKAALPAWSLPKDAVDRIALPADWPERVTREWALGGSTGEGVRVCILDSGVDASTRSSASSRAPSSSPSDENDEIVAERGHRGRRLRPRHRVRGDRAPARARRADLERPRPRLELHGLGRRAPRRPALRDRAGLRRHQHEPLDDEEAVRERPPRARRQRVLQPDRARRVGAQHAGRELPVALLVRDLGRQPRGARPARLLLQPEPTRRVLRPRRERRGAVARRARPHRLGQQLRDPAHDLDLRARSSRSTPS